MTRRWLAILLAPIAGLALAATCDRRGTAPESTAKASAPAKAPAPSLHSSPGVHAGLTLDARTVATRRYRFFGLEPGARFDITATRPDPTDAGVLLVVAGTYTSPDDEVEGLFVVDGVVAHGEPKSWEGALSIVDGRATVERLVARAEIDAARRRAVERKASLLQGHLLVDASARLPIRDSPPLQRRAFVTASGRSFVVESVGEVPLRGFADDLVALGAERALNLDMGTWSGGWYRRRDGERVPLGNDHRATERQSNWLTVRRR